MSITLPDSVTYVDIYAFVGCSSMKDINIPVGLREVAYAVLNDCVSLESIRYGGTMAQWAEEVTFANVWNQNTGNYTVFCIDGEVSKNGSLKPH